MIEMFENLINSIKESKKTYNVEKIEEAYYCAEKAHDGQCRVSGEAYINHPVNVAKILYEMGMDTDSLVAALLHDVVEDTELPLEDVAKVFGKDVALLVDGVTKLGKIKYSSKEQQQAENIRKMLLAMSHDVRVIIIKLADRLHNMRTMAVMEPQKRRDKSRETMEVYAPIAHRLGIRAIKEDLEDLSLRFLDPVGYEEIEKLLELRKDEREIFIKEMKIKIEDRFKSEQIEVNISGRVKSICGIYRKMYMNNNDFDEIYEVYAVRVIVNTVTECYNILGVVHDMFTPIPNRFKDYISTPKKNMYQSLHTTIIDKNAIPVEIQMRTWDMHYTAEYGIAAHWKYKEGVSGKDNLEDRLTWVRQLLEVQKDSEDVEDIVLSIKSDLVQDEVFVFTPGGDVINLPKGATIIDFAYAIHTGVGNKMIGAKINGKLVPIDCAVETGMIVDIMTTKSQNHGPSRDWLKIVKTSGARAKIRSWYKKEKRDENIEEGKSELEKEFKRNYIHFKNEAHMEEFVDHLAKKQRSNTVEDFYATIGYGGISLYRIIGRIKDDYNKMYKQPIDDIQAEIVQKPAKKKSKNNSGVIVEGVEGCLAKFAKCCNPLPGDDIIGFITRGYGVSVHKEDCSNVINADKDQKERWVRVNWQKIPGEKFQSTLEITANSRDRLIADISVSLGNMKIALHSLVAKETGENIVTIQIIIEVEDVEQLKILTKTLNQIRGVKNIQRTVQ